MRVETIGNATLTAIYALCEYPSWRPRYVGKTIQYLHRRHKAHIRAAKAGKRLPIHCWLRKQIEKEQRLAIKLLEYAGDDWAARERFWIERFRGEGFELLNLTDGGEGLAGYKFSAEHRAKIAAALRTGAHFSCLQCGVEFWRKANDIRRGHNKFCSRKCGNVYNKGGFRVS
jgi:predicted RNA-binding Zn-ribbon protein involved in translation (DUF1610 family)